MANEADENRQIDALTTLRDLLVEERAALVARDHAAILECAERKAARAGELQATMPSPAELDGVGPTVRARITALATECNNLNHANGVTVAALRGVVDRALGILRGSTAADDSMVYGPRGARLAGSAGRYAGSA